MTAQIERWLPAVGLEGFYEVSDLGRVRSVDRVVSFTRKSAHSESISTVQTKLPGRVRTPQNDAPGEHLFLMLRGRKFYVHRMVLEAFVGPCPDGQECRHGDDVSTHNKLENLCWGTHSDNMKDAYRNGREPIRGPEIALKAWATKRRRAAEAKLNQPEQGTS